MQQSLADIQLVPATSDDLRVVVSLVDDFFAERPEEILTSRPDLHEHVLRMLGTPNCTYYLITSSQSQLGLMQVVQVSDSLFDVALIYIKPEFRRCGLGGMAVEMLMDLLKCRGAKAVRVEIGAMNSPSQELWTKAEFKVHSYTYVRRL